MADYIKYDVERLRQELFFNEVNSLRIRKLLCLTEPIHGSQLEAALFENVGSISEDPVPETYDNKEVFRAAVLAFASNRRSWARVLQRLELISEMLFQFDYDKLFKDVIDVGNEEILVLGLSAQLGGQTGKKDAKNIITFARHLSKNASYYDKLREFRQRLQDNYKEFTAGELTAVVALTLGSNQFVPAVNMPKHQLSKIFGMGPTLASQFLRNLRWPGFKPDKHIRSLTEEWLNLLSVAERDLVAAERITKFKGLFGGIEGTSDQQFVEYSILGEQLTPAGIDLNKMDLFVWLYGAVVARRGRLGGADRLIKAIPRLDISYLEKSTNY